MVMLKTLGMVLVPGYVKSKIHQERTCLSYCDFLVFVHQSTGGISFTPIWVKTLDKTHKICKSPYSMTMQILF